MRRKQTHTNAERGAAPGGTTTGTSGPPLPDQVQPDSGRSCGTCTPLHTAELRIDDAHLPVSKSASVACVVEGKQSTLMLGGCGGKWLEGLRNVRSKKHTSADLIHVACRILKSTVVFNFYATSPPSQRSGRPGCVHKSSKAGERVWVARFFRIANHMRTARTFVFSHKDTLECDHGL